MIERLQKKCFIASVGLHLTLLAVFFFGSGFLGSRKVDNLPLLEFVPMITTDANVSGGGNPNARPPPAPLPALQPQRQAVQPANPPKPTPKLVKPDPNSLETKPAKKYSKQDIVLRPWTGAAPKPTLSNPNTSSQNDTQARADAQRRQLAGSAVRTLRENLSSGTSVEMPGPGGGGATYANYKQVVGSIYYEAWIVPDDVDTEAATAVASVVIARDGTVISASLTKSSSNKAVDRSVQATLDRVRFIAPFPEGAKESQRTFTINFNLKAKKAIG